jgi:energy-coupling factor transport system ATP-binding protein
VSEIVADVLARMHLADLALRPPFALSRGQRLRTAVASVLSQMPMVLLLDEPTTGQDRDQIERLMTSLEDAFDLVVFCTHDVDTAASHATRVILLDQGRVIRDGPPEESLFDDASMERASVLPTSVQAYSRRLGEPTLTVDSLWAMLK